MTRIKSKTEHILLLLCIMYKALLDFLYLQYISGPYKFYGFYGEFSWPLYCLSWIFFILFSFVIIHITHKTQDLFSSLLLFVYYLIYFVPFSAMFYAGYRFNYIIYSVLVWAFLVLYFSQLTERTIIFTLNGSGFVITRKSATIIIFILSVLICLSVVYLSWRFTGFRMSFNEAYTYIYRAQAFDYTTSAFWGYLYSWSRLIIPVMLCLALVRQRYLLAVGLFLLKMLSFGFDGMRLDLLITLIAVGTAIIYRKNISQVAVSRLFVVILTGMIGLCLLSIIEHTIFKTGEIDRVITFRVLFLPNLIASWFIRFFESNPPDYFRQSFLRYFGFKSPYAEIGLDYIISDFINGGDGRANNGLVADCMTNFGIVGFIFQPFVVAIWAAIMNKVTKTVHISVILLLAIYFAYCLTNNFFMIILFTNGGFIIIIYLLIYNRIRSMNDKMTLLKYNVYKECLY